MKSSGKTCYHGLTKALGPFPVSVPDHAVQDLNCQRKRKETLH